MAVYGSWGGGLKATPSVIHFYSLQVSKAPLSHNAMLNIPFKSPPLPRLITTTKDETNSYDTQAHLHIWF